MIAVKIHSGDYSCSASSQWEIRMEGRKAGQSEREDVGRHVTLCGVPHSEKRLIADFHPLIPLIRPRDISKPVNYNVE